MSRPRWAKQQRIGICPYCGQSSNELTLDHVIPKGLFPPPRPGDIPKVMACPACNNRRKSLSDVYLRDLLVNDHQSAQSPAAQQVAYDGFARASEQRNSAFLRDATRSKMEEMRSPSGIITGIKPATQRLAGVHTESGLFVGWMAGVNVPNEGVQHILGPMVRGLYRYYMQQDLPHPSRFAIARKYDLPTVELEKTILHAEGARRIQVGTGEVFNCTYGFDPARPQVSVWYLCFYGRAYWYVATNIPAGIEM